MSFIEDVANIIKNIIFNLSTVILFVIWLLLKLKPDCIVQILRWAIVVFLFLSLCISFDAHCEWIFSFLKFAHLDKIICDGDPPWVDSPKSFIKGSTITLSILLFIMIVVFELVDFTRKNKK